MKKKLLIFICLVLAYRTLLARDIDGVWIGKDLYDYWIKNPYVEDLSANTVIINNKKFLRFFNNIYLRKDKMTLHAVGGLGPWKILSIKETAENKVNIVLQSNTDKDATGTLIITFLDEDLVTFSEGECSEIFLKEVHGSDLDTDGKTQYIRKILDNEPKIIVTKGALMCCIDNLRIREYGGFFGKVKNSMKKGTKVKVVEIGNENYIDGVVSSWVEVEVIEDSLTTKGEPLPKGTRGWCFGAYLTLLDDGSK